MATRTRSQSTERIPGLTISLGESINVPAGALAPLKLSHVRSVSDSGPSPLTPFVSKLPPAVANVPKDDIRGYVHSKRVNSYLVGSTLGEGSFAKVKEAFHVLVGEKVALKVIDKKKALQDAYVARNFRREAKLLQMVRHPNILQLLEVIETENSYYLITELCSGGELMKHIYRKGKLDEEETRKYMRQIISSVDHLHKAGIIHRDLKVENLLLDANNDIKIIDFGLSNEEFTNGENGRIHCSTQCGSPAYAAPELLGHKEYGPEVDIWSIGVNMYAMLTGCLPYTVEPFNITALHAKMLENKMNPIPAHLSSSCKDLLRRLLTSNPEERIKMAELVFHPWLSEGEHLPFQLAPFPNFLTINNVNEDVTEHMVHVLKVKESEEEIKKELMANRASTVAAIYSLLSARLARYQKHYPAKTTRVRKRSKSHQDSAYWDDNSDAQSIVSCPTNAHQRKASSFKDRPVTQQRGRKARPISDIIIESSRNRVDMIHQQNQGELIHQRRKTMPPSSLERDLAQFQLNQQRGKVEPLPDPQYYNTVPRRKPLFSDRSPSPTHDDYEHPLVRPDTHLAPIRPPRTMPRNYSQPQTLYQLKQDLKSHLPQPQTPAWHSQPSSRVGSRNPSRASSRNTSRNTSCTSSNASVSIPPELTELNDNDDLEFHDAHSYIANNKHTHQTLMKRNTFPSIEVTDAHFPTIPEQSSKTSRKTSDPRNSRRTTGRNGFLSPAGDIEIRTDLPTVAILSEVIRVASNLKMREFDQNSLNTVTCLWKGVRFLITVIKERIGNICRLNFQWLSGGDHKAYLDICDQIVKRVTL